MSAQFCILGYLDKADGRIAGPMHGTSRIALGLPKAAQIAIEKRAKGSDSGPDWRVLIVPSPDDEGAEIAVLWTKHGDGAVLQSGRFAPEFAVPKGLPASATVIVMRAREGDDHGHGFVVKYVVDDAGGNGGRSQSQAREFEDDSDDPFSREG